MHIVIQIPNHAPKASDAAHFWFGLLESPAPANWSLASRPNRPSRTNRRKGQPRKKQSKRKRKPLRTKILNFVPHTPNLSPSPRYILTRHVSQSESKWHPLPVFEFRPRRFQRRTKDSEWHPPATQAVQVSSPSTTCQNGSSANPTPGSSTDTGPSRVRLEPLCAVGCTSTTSRSTFTRTSYRPSYSCSARGISPTTLPADTHTLAPAISSPSPSSC